MNLPDPHPLEDHLIEGLRLRLRALDRHCAEDASQEALVAALVRPPDRPDCLPAWLYRVATTHHLKRLRGDRRRARREVAVARPEQVADPPALVLRAELGKLVAAAVNELCEPTRSAIRLRYFEGLPALGIASRLGVPVDTVHTRLKRGRVRLRRSLAFLQEE